MCDVSDGISNKHTVHFSCLTTTYRSNFTVVKHGQKENVLFNDTHFNKLYGVGHMVKEHSNSKRGNPMPPLQLAARVILYASSHGQDSTYHGNHLSVI